MIRLTCISELDSKYSITEDGKIYSHYRHKFMSPETDRYGYLRITLYTSANKKKHYLIHRLVGLQFLPNPDNLPQINHKDGNKLNNSISNLEWCSASYNIEHAYMTGLKVNSESNRKLASEHCSSLKREKNHNFNDSPIFMLDKVTKEIIREFNCALDAAHYLGKKKSSNILSCCNGKEVSAYNFCWKYKKDLTS